MHCTAKVKSLDMESGSISDDIQATDNDDSLTYQIDTPLLTITAETHFCSY